MKTTIHNLIVKMINFDFPLTIFCNQSENNKFLSENRTEGFNGWKWHYWLRAWSKRWRDSGCGSDSGVNSVKGSEW